MSDTSDTDTTDDESTDYETAREDSGAMRGPREHDPIELYEHMRHRVNGDETAVLVCSFGRGYQVLAIDVTADGELLAVEDVGSIETDDRAQAEGIAEYWIQQHPKGILGGSPDEDGGFLAKLGFGGGEST